MAASLQSSSQFPIPTSCYPACPLPISQFLCCLAHFLFLCFFLLYFLLYREPWPSLILFHFFFSSFFMAHALSPSLPLPLFSSSTDNLTSPSQSPSFLFLLFLLAPSPRLLPLIFSLSPSHRLAHSRILLHSKMGFKLSKKSHSFRDGLERDGAERESRVFFFFFFLNGSCRVTYERSRVKSCVEL
jgi:hypothetical protein